MAKACQSGDCRHFVARLQATFYVGCRRRRRCRHTYIHANEKIRTYIEWRWA